MLTQRNELLARRDLESISDDQTKTMFKQKTKLNEGEAGPKEAFRQITGMDGNLRAAQLATSTKSTKAKCQPRVGENSNYRRLYKSQRLSKNMGWDMGRC